jgi:hypothetical protein
LQARYMSAAQGRFNSPDPGNAGADLTNPQSWNGYSYVWNNPLSAVDPTGMDIWFPGPCEDPEDPECGGEPPIPPPCFFFDCGGGGNGGGQSGSGQGGTQTAPSLPAPARFVSRWRNVRTAARDEYSFAAVAHSGVRVWPLLVSIRQWGN